VNILITPDDSSIKKEQFSFFVYDINTTKLLHAEPKNVNLDCPQDIDKGRSTFRPFGIEIDKDNIYITSNSKLAVFDKNSYEYKTNINVPLFVNTHQIVKVNDVFYVCNTAVDTIGIYGKEHKHLNVNTKVVSEKVASPSDCDKHDLSHVNSIYEHEGYIYYCLHNLGIRQSQFFRFNIVTLDVEYIFDGGHCAHNIVILDNVLYSLSSDTGEIIVYELRSKKLTYHKVVQSEVTFLRGLAVYKDLIYFGASNNFNIDAIKENCNIFSFNPKTNKVEHVMHLPDLLTITDFKLFY
jgi:hypothetical protein